MNDEPLLQNSFISASSIEDAVDPKYLQELLDVSKPLEMEVGEYDDVISQVQLSNEFSMEDCIAEFVDAARYNDLDLARAMLHVHGSPESNVGTKSILVNACTSEDRGKHSALHMAAGNGHVDMVRLLIHFGANISAVNAAGNTPLHWAASNGHTPVVKVLLLNAALQSKSSRPAPVVPDSGTTGEDLKSLGGIDVLQRNNAGRSVLTEAFASEQTSPELLAVLLEHSSATESRLVDIPGVKSRLMEDVEGKADSSSTADAPATASITHEFIFGPRMSPHQTQRPGSVVAKNLHVAQQVQVRIRELTIASSNKDTILGQETPSQDTTGLGIWGSSLVAAQWLADVPMRLLAACGNDGDCPDGMDAGISREVSFGHLGPVIPLDAVVVEVGAGCGVPGLTLAAVQDIRANQSQRTLSAQTTIHLTDFNDVTIDNLLHNIKLNSSGGAGSAVCSAEFMNWQDPNTWPVAAGSVDVVVGSDLIYQFEMVELLVQTIVSLLKPNTGMFYYVAPTSACRQGHHEFIAALTATGVGDHSPKMELVRQLSAPERYYRTVNPLSSEDDEEWFVHFSDVHTNAEGFQLYEFRRSP
jgi:Lysine methyltransferase/Ankyrin repeats (many copies)